MYVTFANVYIYMKVVTLKIASETEVRISFIET